MQNKLYSLLLAGIFAFTLSGAASAQYYEAPMPEAFLTPEPLYNNESLGWGGQRAFDEGYQTYTIKKGDTLGSISQKFFGTTQEWKRIASVNNISDPAKIKVGQILEIPTIRRVQPQNRFYSRQVNFDAAPVVVSVPTAPAPAYSAAPAANLSLPPVTTDDDAVLYSGAGLPQIILPGDKALKPKNEGNHVCFNGLTGLVNTFSAYPLGEKKFSTAMGFVWNDITRREGERLYDGEEAEYYEFPVLLTYSGENFEAAFKMPFESYDVFAPKTYNFRSDKDSGMGDVAFRLKFCSQSEEMASCLGIGAIFPTSDIEIGNADDNNAWEIFAGLSTKRKEGGNLHINGGYQSSDGDSVHKGTFVNLGFDYDGNESFTFMGEINYYDGDKCGDSCDLTLGARYYIKEGMSITLAAPIALSNDMFFGYDFRLQGMFQCHY